MSLKVVIYARVSSAAQRERETIASQLRALRAYAKARKWTAVAEYIDDGISASSGHLEQRIGLRAMLSKLAGIDAVLVLDVDRLSRAEDLIERAAVLGTIQRAGVQIALMSTGSVHDADDLTLTIQGYGAADWTKKHRERIKRGKLEAIHRGGKPAGPTPYGYRYDKHGKVWSIDPATSAVVRDIFRRVAVGESMGVIARDLQDEGVPRPRCGLWRRERIWTMIRRETYLGRWIADKAKRLVVAVPPIVTQAEWDAANEASCRPALRGISRTWHVYLCERIGRCGLCGGRMVILSPRPTRPAYYWCTNRRGRPGQPKCMLPMFQVGAVDGPLWAAVSDMLMRPDAVAQALAEKAAEGEDGDAWARDLKHATAVLERLEKAAAGALARHRRGLVSEAVLDAELEANARERVMAERQVVAARSQLKNITAARGRVRGLEVALADLRGAVAGATPEQRRDMVRALMDGGTHVVVLGPQAGEVTAYARIGARAAVEDVAQAFAAHSNSERLKPVTLRLVVSPPAGDTCESRTKKAARRR